MTSVNHQQYAPYHANYEMPPKPASNPSEGSAEACPHAKGQNDSRPPRTPMTSQQRGQLSAHNRLMNDSLQALTAPQPSLLEQMRPAFEGAQVLGVQKRIEDEVSKWATPQPSCQPMSTQQRGQFSTHRDLANAPASTAQTDTGRLAQLSKENGQLRDQLTQMADHFNSVIGQLRQKVADLTQKISQPAEPAKEGLPSTPDVSNDAERSSAHDANASNKNAPVSAQKEPQTLEELTTVNKQLRETIDQIQIHFNELFKQLQEQIQTLNKKLDERGAPPTQPAPQDSGTGANPPAGSPSVAPTPDTREAISPPQASETTSPQTRTVDDLLLDNGKLRDRIKEMVEQCTKVILELKLQIEQISARLEAKAAQG
ncbi:MULTISPECIES: hypothetical protein [Pseudomonas]|uniref:Uncharacterized protein n=1 Tax=Pseudomonas azadiae TaxID=2843612 RepID=A0ABS6NV29_9PSED|nr:MULTISPECIES: hypothetical protein [Pseudomonas]MBV4452052.1 hypothetical protein [Pseudomonas azadiae]NMF39376.1 hypothetical protein [Pseudomonas sp. SWRI 103]